LADPGLGQDLEECHQRGKRVIYATWHGRMLISIFHHRGQGIRVMVSQHRDGEFIARVIRHLGYEPIRGSSSQGGARALKEMLDRAADGTDMAITPDGPRGPRCRVQPGVIYLAKLTGRPIIPLTSGAGRGRLLSSWDRLLLPYPFSRCVVLYGEPIWVPADSFPEELEERRRELEDRLNRDVQRADSFFGA